jgi:hypothetical protein
MDSFECDIERSQSLVKRLDQAVQAKLRSAAHCLGCSMKPRLAMGCFTTSSRSPYCSAASMAFGPCSLDRHLPVRPNSRSPAAPVKGGVKVDQRGGVNLSLPDAAFGGTAYAVEQFHLGHPQQISGIVEGDSRVFVISHHRVSARSLPKRCGRTQRYPAPARAVALCLSSDTWPAASGMQQCDKRSPATNPSVAGSYAAMSCVRSFSGSRGIALGRLSR